MKNKKKKNEFYKMLHLIEFVRKINPWYFPLAIIRNICSCVKMILSLILLAEVLDCIVSQESERDTIFFVILFVVSTMLLTLLMYGIDKILIVIRRKIEDTAEIYITEKALTMDYQILEKADIQNWIEQTREELCISGGFSTYCYNITELFSLFMNGVSALVILSGLFLKAKETAFILFFVFLIVAVFNSIIIKKENQLQDDFLQECVPLNRQFSFFNRFIVDYWIGKQVRIYHMSQMLLNMMKKREHKYAEKSKKNLKKTIFCQSEIQIVNSCLLLFFSYIFIGTKAIYGIISIGDLALYVGAITSFAQFITQFLHFLSYIIIGNKYLFHYIEFLELRNEKYEGTLPIEKRLDNEYELEFRNVSFHYPNSKELVLKHITAKIQVGGTMAIVGKNGSGKSTFIKLLCRLYDPTEGEILLNNIDIKKYDYDEYRRIFSIVFQDFKLFSFSIAENVAANNFYNKEKVWFCLKKAGFSEKVKEMSNGIETVIYKEGEDGVEISGGEEQKLAIARALYKDAPVVILDEPTAALDPVSELEIYERFDEMVQEKTAIYISHRMSSCRFCKNIIVFDNGNIVQHGSHEELLKEKEGLYHSLWNAQAQYYI